MYIDKTLKILIIKINVNSLIFNFIVLYKKRPQCPITGADVPPRGLATAVTAGLDSAASASKTLKSVKLLEQSQILTETKSFY